MRSFSSSKWHARPARLDELGITRLDMVNAAQHLANDHFDVLVVDLHALQTIDVLNFVGDVTSQRLDTLQAQDVVRIRRPSTIFSPLLTT
jgi:uncharacterized UPF0146 family protein